MFGRGRRWRATTIALLSVAAISFLSAAAVGKPLPPQSSTTHTMALAKPAANRTGVTVATTATKNSIPYGIPPLVISNAFDKSSAEGGKLGSAITFVEKAKVTATVSDAPVLGYLQICLDILVIGDTHIQTCCPNATDVSTCPAADIVHPPTTSQDDNGGFSWTRVVAPVWIGSPHSRRFPAPRQFGTFPDARVSLLAFGSIPVTATVHLSQPIGANGYVTPLTFNYLNVIGTVPHGTTVAGYPLPNPGGDTEKFDADLRIAGPVQVRLSGVRVDGVLVQVGPNCHTSTPAALSFDGPHGWYDPDLPASTYVGKAGGFQPLNLGGTGSIVGNIALPAFSGCRDGTRSLDPLITAMTSSAHNSVLLTLKRALFDCDKVKCPTYPTVNGVVTSAAPSAADPLPTAAQLSRLVATIKAESPAVRDSVLRSLPTPLAEVVRSRI